MLLLSETEVAWWDMILFQGVCFDRIVREIRSLNRGYMRTLHEKFAGKFLDPRERFRLDLKSSTADWANGLIVDDRPNEAEGWGSKECPIRLQVPQELLSDGLLLSQVLMRLPEIRRAAQRDGSVVVVVSTTPVGHVAININPSLR